MKLKILSWNIWCGTFLNEVIEFLKNADADIIALQEASESDLGNMAEVIGKKLGYEYVHAINMSMPLRFLPGHKKSDEKGTIKYGNVILSRYKITRSKIYELSKENNFRRLIIEADIEVESENLHIFSIHLKHTHQKQLALQDLEVDNLLKLLPEKNVIVMGDFNSLPGSAVIKMVGQTLQDAETGLATPTWSMYKAGCTVCLVEDVKYKLDYIFVSRNLMVNSFRAYSSKGSDHLPISAIIEI